jgi:hypothetical protein
LSYLKGPLKKEDIALLMESFKKAPKDEIMRPVHTKLVNQKTYQQIDVSIPQYFEPDPMGNNDFFATLRAKATVRFFSQRRGIDEEQHHILSLSLEESMRRINWEESQEEESDFENFPHLAPKEARFTPLPQFILEDRGLRKSIRELKDHLYQTKAIALWRSSSPKLESRIGESKMDFMVRLNDILQEKKEEEIEKLKERYAKKEKVLLDRLERAKARVEKEEMDSTNSLIEAGISILGALFGKTSVTKIGRAVNKGGKILKEQGEMSRAQERVVSVQDDLDMLVDELDEKIDILSSKYNIDNCEVIEFKIKPRKTDIDIESCALVWCI